MDECIFCKIATDQLPSSKVYEDDDCLAILDINPVSRGHLLVLIREHWETVAEVPPDLLARGKLISRNLFRTSGTWIAR